MFEGISCLKSQDYILILIALIWDFYSEWSKKEEKGSFSWTLILSNIYKEVPQCFEPLEYEGVIVQTGHFMIDFYVLHGVDTKWLF